MDSASGLGGLHVRSRKVITSGGGTVTEFTVYCPFRRRTVNLDVCEECSAYEAASEDADGSPKAIACRRIGPAPELPDVAETAARATLERTPVSRIMAHHVVCVQGDLPLRDLPGILLRHRISGVPVIDDEFRPIGMVTKTDLIRRGYEMGTEGEESALPRRSGSAAASGFVAEVMTPSVTALGERASLIEAAQQMAERGVHRVVVVARDGRIVGILSSLDVLKWLSRELPSGEGVAGAVET